MLEHHLAQKQIRNNTERVIRNIAANWDANIGWRGYSSQLLLARIASQVVLAAKKATIVSATRYAELLDLEIPDEIGVPDDIRGVPIELLYERPHDVLWSSLRKGVEFPTALSLATDRLARQTLTDVQLYYTHAMKEIIAGNPTVTKFLRVESPDGSCALCALASQQVYNRGDLMPIHENCDCTVEPLQTFTPAAKDINANIPDDGRPLDGFTVLEHPEMGPLLTTF